MYGHQKKNIKIPMLIIGLIVIVCISFFAGTKYEKWYGKKTGNNNLSQNGGFPGGFGGQQGQRPTVGTVTAIADKKITISLENNGGDKTIEVTDNTKINNNRSEATISDIKTDDTIMVIGQTGNSGNIEAQMIEINPSFNSSSGNGSSNNSSVQYQ